MKKVIRAFVRRHISSLCFLLLFLKVKNLRSMEIKTVTVKLENNPHQYVVEIGHDLLANSGAWAQRCLSPRTRKIALVSNAKVFGLYGEAVRGGFENQGFQTRVFLMKDGEKHKNFRVLESLLKFLGENKLTRSDAIVALGGGVVGDLAGFAAAIFLRGLAFLQMPTTLLSMIDSSVGGKTGVNSSFGKNLIGAFHQPRGVLIDVGTLKTLPRRELVAGFCEAVKQAAIADRNLFDQTADFTKNFPLVKFKNSFSNEKFVGALENLIAAQIAFKAQIVMQDEKNPLTEATRNHAKS
jgi:3-dehydroquinate synthase